MPRERFGLSERRARQVVGVHRSTQWLDPLLVTDDEAERRQFLRDFSKRRLRWGCRRAEKEAHRTGRLVNDKRVRQLWRDEGLRVPTKKRKKHLTGIGAHVGAICPIRPNALRAMDFQFDTLANGRMIKRLNVIDEFAGECPTIDVDHPIDADQVVATPDHLTAARSAPVHVRFDNGPEFVAYAVTDRCRCTPGRTGRHDTKSCRVMLRDLGFELGSYRRRLAPG